MYEFKAPTNLHWDCDAGKEVCQILEANSWQRVAVVADKGLIESGVADPVLNRIAELDHHLFELDRFEPEIDFLDVVTEKFRSFRPSVVLGLGGGSAMDMAKGVSGMLTNLGLGSTYQGFDLLKNPGVPSIMIPTTAGTGSEVTWTAVFTNKTSMRKLGINSRHILPSYALLDPTLTVSLPMNITVASGMDAISHAIESFTARNSNTLSRIIALDAFKLLVGNLPQVLNVPNDTIGRSNMQLGSTLAGWAILNAGTGACHSVAYALGTHCGIPHGVAIALLLPHVMRSNVSKDPSVYSELYESLGYSRTGSSRDSSYKLIDLIEGVLESAHFTVKLGDFMGDGITIDFLAERGLELSSALDNNPTDFDVTDAKYVLQSAL